MCGKCGRFVANVTGHFKASYGDGYLDRVTGSCARCGEVDAVLPGEFGWSTEDFGDRADTGGETP